MRNKYLIITLIFLITIITGCESSSSYYIEDEHHSLKVYLSTNEEIKELPVYTDYISSRANPIIFDDIKEIWIQGPLVYASVEKSNEIKKVNFKLVDSNFSYDQYSLDTENLSSTFTLTLITFYRERYYVTLIPAE